MPGTTAQLRRARGETIGLSAVIAYLLGLKLYFTFGADLIGDEAYYWLWGQHLSWSYFDHPPLHAWLLRLVDMVFGWHRASVRLLTWLTLGGTLGIFWAWGRRLAPEDRAGWYLRVTAVYLASPFFFAMTTVAYHDHLLIFLGLLAIHCFVIFTERHESGAPGGLRWLYLAALALGLATLAKYNGIVVGLGLAAAFLVRPRLRALLKTPHPWLAALLAVALQAPVLYWNLAEGFASYRFHMLERWGGGGFWHVSAVPPLLFVVLNVVVLSPFLVAPIIRLLRAAPQSPFEDAARSVAVATMALSSLLFFVVTALIGGYFYWNVLAFVAIVPLIVRHIGRGALLWAHLAYGVVISTLILVNFAVTPLQVGVDNRGSAVNIGWDEVAGQMRAARAAYPDDLIAGTRYSTTSQLGFALATTEAVPIANEALLQYGYWFEPAKIAGKSVLVLADEGKKSAVVRNLHQRFARVTLIADFPIRRFGQEIYRWRIYRGEDYRP